MFDYGNANEAQREAINIIGITVVKHTTYS